MTIALSLRAKLILLVAALITAITVFVSTFFPARLERIARQGAERRAVSMATVLAAAVAPGLEFDDPVNVKDLLDQLATAEGVSYVAVRKADGAPFADWHAERMPAAALKADRDPIVEFRAEVIHVVVPVRAKAGAKGSVILGVSLAELEHEKEQNRAAVALVAAIMLAVGLAGAFALGTFLVGPIRRMTRVALRIAEGDLSQPELAIGGRDEVGRMAEAFDRMLRALRGLAGAADDVAAGDLRGRLEVSGQVAEAFNRMMEAQRLIVREIATTSERLARAAAETYAASQEQEAAATIQASGVEQVSRTMAQLSESAANISDSARGVLANAERTRETSEITAAKIAELSGHTNRIGEILEIIRDIADRSDLLALNASIEGTRAGEAGRAFSLVAAEMRRLAERVTASVQDVKALVADVRASGSSTVMATEEGRRLAESTTESARLITTVTQQQRTGTEQVSRSMNEIATVLAQSVTSTQKTRSLAEDLKHQADRLAEIVGRFRVEGRAGEASGERGAGR
jgi:methyl-accepting chemotaxis protein